MKTIYIIMLCFFSSCSISTQYKLNKVYFIDTINTYDKFGNKQGWWESGLCKRFKHNEDEDFIILIPFRNNKIIFSYKNLYHKIKKRKVQVKHNPKTSKSNYINGSIIYYKDDSNYNELFFDNGILPIYVVKMKTQ